MQRKLWWRKRGRPRRSGITKHYQLHKEQARDFIVERTHYWNQFYNYDFGRIAIRNQKTCWGSCSSNRNLNFNYKILFLPRTLADYIIVHELCHLEEFNHSKNFWALVERQIPDYKVLRKELRDYRVDTRRKLEPLALLETEPEEKEALTM